MIAHERDCLIGADARLRADRKIDRAETVGSAIDEVAKKHDHAFIVAFGLARSLVDKRGKEIAPSVNVADSENLGFRRRAQRQRKSSTLDDRGH